MSRILPSPDGNWKWNGKEWVLNDDSVNSFDQTDLFIQPPPMIDLEKSIGQYNENRLIKVPQQSKIDESSLITYSHKSVVNKSELVDRLPLPKRFGNPLRSNREIENNYETSIKNGPSISLNFHLGSILFWTIASMTISFILLSILGAFVGGESIYTSNLTIEDENGIEMEVSYQFYEDKTIVSTEPCWFIFCGDSTSFEGESITESSCIGLNAPEECSEKLVGSWQGPKLSDWFNIWWLHLIVIALIPLSNSYKKHNESHTPTEYIFEMRRLYFSVCLGITLFLVVLVMMFTLSQWFDIHNAIKDSALIMNPGKSVSVLTYPNVITECVFIYLIWTAIEHNSEHISL
tara:strand:+ start:438 stop:1481 length:1044 start_codon:yes stop_codon:yes gene_type:complete